jgi:protein-tyrosine-phosphatase
VTVPARDGLDWPRQVLTFKVLEGLRSAGDRFDYVITVCDRARETCPVFPGSINTLHWGLDDPSEVQGTDDQRTEAFRHTVVELAARLRPFIEIALRAHRPPAPTIA